MKNPLSALKRTFTRGFTLVELMITIAIIALLTALIMVDFVQTRGSARDGKRISDLAQIQLSLEQYFDRCGQYPLTLSISASDGCPSGQGITLGSFLSKIPTPPASPLSTQTQYDYSPMDPLHPTGGSGTVPVDYLLHVTLEYQNPVQASGIPNTYKNNLLTTYTTLTSGWQVQTACYDSTVTSGAGFTDYCLGPK